MLQKIKIVLDFKWNYGLCGHVLTRPQIQAFWHNISKTKQMSAKKQTNRTYRKLFNAPKQNCMRNSERFNKDYFWVNNLAPFFHRSLQLRSNEVLLYFNSNRVYLQFTAFLVFKRCSHFQWSHVYFKSAYWL